jgi:membrane-bound lytic murein transglycosylase A
LLFACLAFFSLADGAAACAQERLSIPEGRLEPVRWADLPGWADDDQLTAFGVFQGSCQPFRAVRNPLDPRPIFRALWEVCRRAAAQKPVSREAARAFFEGNFRPVRIARLGETDGFLTGYFEPIVSGSRFPSPEFHVPLYRRPHDLVVAGHKGGAEPFPNKGALVGRLNEKKQLVPYHDRGAIEAGALDGQKLEICWLKDPFDALMISIQGSARVILEDGTPLRINYDSYNGYPFTAVGRALIEHREIAREEMSMQRIRDWMAANPDAAAKVRATNRSYVFFRITGLSNDGEPVGAQGVPLTPGRSIAVDRAHAYGTPFFIEASLPIDNARADTPFRRLMIAQDTGSAIVGPARADLYFGAGADAGRIAGRVRHPGHFVMLVPRELEIDEFGKEVPLPVAKPKIPEAQASKENKDTAQAGKPAPADARRLDRSPRHAAPARWRYYRLW